MARYLVRVKAIEAFLGNKHESIFWHYRVFARNPEDAKAICRNYQEVPQDAPMETFALPQWDRPYP